MSTAGVLSTVVVQTAYEAVDVTTKVASNVSSTAVAAANTMAMEVTATSKTPQPSNVTKNKKVPPPVLDGRGADGRYADYVIPGDGYSITLIPPPPVPRAGGKYIDPSTPAFMMGAVAAGRCGLPEDHPNHPEYIPADIPRILEISQDWEERAGFFPLEKLLLAENDENAYYGGEGRKEQWSVKSGVTLARTTIDTAVDGLPLPPYDPIDMDDVQGSVTVMEEIRDEDDEEIGDEVNEEELLGLRPGVVLEESSNDHKNGGNTNVYCDIRTIK